MICFRLLDAKDPAQPLADAVHALAQGTATQDTYAVDPVSFRHVPNAPFAYWVSDTIRKLFTTLPPFENEERTVKQGLATADDYRFVRCSWETPLTPEELTQRSWYHFAKGGSYSPFYADIHLKVNWADQGNEIKNYIIARYPYLNGNAGFVAKNTDYYFRPGLTYPRRLHRLSVAPIQEGTVISVRGSGIYSKREDLLQTAGLFSSNAFDFLVKCMLGRFGHPQFDNGALSKTPVPKQFPEKKSRFEAPMIKGIHGARILDTAHATSHAFVAPALAPSRVHSTLG